jgi:hypothetical protein
MLTTAIYKMILNKTSHSDYLSIFITLPQQQTMLLEENGEVGMVEEVRSPGVLMDEVGGAKGDNILV